MTKLPWLLVPLLAALCLYLGWDNVRLRTRRLPAVAAPVATGPVIDSVACESVERVVFALQRSFPAAPPPAAGDEPPGMKLSAQAAIAFLAPQPGESLVAYRDRMLPVARALVSPHRERVGKLRSRFVESAGLDGEQQRVLDEAVDAAGEALKDRILQGVLSGELNLRMKPASGVAFARDLLDAADGANRRLRGALRPEQLAVLDEDRFDIAEYVLFRTRWEDMLGVKD